MKVGRARLSGLVAASLLLHLAVLAAMGVRTPAPAPIIDPLPPEPFLIDLRPRRTPAGERRPEPRRGARPDDGIDRLWRPPTMSAPVAAAAASPPVATPPVEAAVDPRLGRIGPLVLPRGAGGGRPGLLACQTPERLDADRRVDCERRLAEAAARVGPIRGSGDARRDARFARQGDAALARYAERRRIGPSERIPCDKPGPIADCEIEVRVDVWSSTGGWLPNQRRGD